MSLRLKSLSARQAIFVFLLLGSLQIFPFSAFSQYREIYRGNDESNSINGMSFLTPSTGFAAFTDFIGFTTDSGRTFIQRKVESGNTDFNSYPVNLTFGFYAQGVKAFTKDSLFAYGHFGTEPSILFSSDQGQHWKVVFHKGLNAGAAVLNLGITDMVFPGNGNMAFAVHDEEVLASNDRGQTWRVAISIPFGTMQKISFPSPTTGYVIGGGKLYKTTDKGATWLPATLPGDISKEYFNNVCFPSLSSGYISEYESGSVYKTTDGGSNWKKMNETGLQVKGRDMIFTNDSTGYITPEYAYDIYKTTDNGTTWEPCKRNTDYQYLAYGMQSLHFLNEKTGWAGGKKEYLMLTTNGGGQTRPLAMFSVDTTGYEATGQVHLINYSKKTYQYKWYVNDELVSTSYDAVYSHYYFSYQDAITLIVSNGTDSDTATQNQFFYVQPLPTIRTFYPKTAAEGSIITITGDYLNYAKTVSFGGVPASSFKMYDDTIIYAIVGKGASGAVSTASVHGATSLAGFTFLQQPTAAPPVIASFSPKSGPVGTTVTITGTNFNASTSGNMVFFGAVQAVVSSASSTKIVCKVPVGSTFTAPSVLNTATHLTGYATQPFNVTFADSSLNFTGHSFEKVAQFPSQGIENFKAQHVWSLAACDIDGDGKIDIASSQTCSSAIDSLVFYRNVSKIDDIQFETGKNMSHRAGFISSADIDGDGKIDFAVIDHWNYGGLSIVRNTSTKGNISSDPALEFPYNSNILPVVFADFDNDGRPDIAVPKSGDTSVRVLKNTSTPGNISLNSGTYFNLGGIEYQLTSIATGDLDGDGKTDIILVSNSRTDQTDYEIQFLKNTSSSIISFAPVRNLTRTPQVNIASKVLLADVDGDNVNDIVITDQKAYYVYKNVLKNGVVSLKMVDSLDMTFLGGGGSFVDNLDGDHKPDLANAMRTSETLYLMKNLSSSNSASLDRPVGLYTQAGETGGADFNNDGKEDIWSREVSWSPDISIFINKIGKIIPVTMCTASSGFLESDVEGSSYQWQQDKGNGFVNVFDDNHFLGAKEVILNIMNPPAEWNGNKFRCIAEGHISSIFTAVVSNKPTPVVSIMAKDTLICMEDTVVIDATVKNTDSTTTYEWLENGYNYGTYEPPTHYISNHLGDGDQVSLVVYNRDACFNKIADTSNIITIRQIGKIPELRVESSDFWLCPGKEITYTAIVDGPVSNPKYQWILNNKNIGTNDPVFKISTLQKGDVLQVKVTTGATACYTGGDLYSGKIIPEFVDAQPIAVSISASDSVICGSKSVTFTANASNTTTAASYQWMLNNVQVGNSNTYTSTSLANGDKVKLLLRDNLYCYGDTTASSNFITMKVTNAVANAGEDKLICPGGQAIIGAEPVANYTYSWTSVPAGYSSSQSANIITPSTSATYILLASINNCQAKDSVFVTISPATSLSGLPVSPVVLCKGSSVQLGVTAENGFSYNWVSEPAGFTSSLANPSASPLIPTTYIVTKTSLATGCTATGQVTTEPSDCVTETKSYPNPASDFVTIQTDLTNLQNVFLELFDSRGKTILVQRLADSKTIRVSGFSDGLYKYVIRQDGVIKSKGALIVKHN